VIVITLVLFGDFSRGIGPEDRAKDIKVLCLNQKTETTLRSAGLTTIGDLVDMECIPPGIGEGGLTDINIALSYYNIWVSSSAHLETYSH